MPTNQVQIVHRDAPVEGTTLLRRTRESRPFSAARIGIPFPHPPTRFATAGDTTRCRTRVTIRARGHSRTAADGRSRSSRRMNAKTLRKGSSVMAIRRRHMFLFSLAVAVALGCLSNSALADLSASPRKAPIVTLDAHALLGPFQGPEEYFGCQRSECFDGWLVTVHAHRPTSAWGNSGAQYVSTKTPSGWYVDSRPNDPFLCGRDVDLPGSGSRAHLWLVEFFHCDVDPPDGTFLGELAGIVLCDVTSTKPLCSEFAALRGWDAGNADIGHAKLAPVIRVGDDIQVAGHRFRLLRRH